jgi:hypothetical protein
MNEIADLRRLLTVWGRVCQVMGVGYPSMASFERARVGRGGVFDGPNIPDWLADIDWCVTTSLPQHKLIIVEAYTKSGDWRDHAARLKLSVDSYFRRKKRAEVYLNTRWRTANEVEMLRAS